jgi:S1-C subfamily serine protease
MKRFLFGLAMTAVVLAGLNCATAPDAPAMLNSLQGDINRAVKSLEPSLVYAEIGGSRNVAGVTGLVISDTGQILLPVYLKQDSYDRVQVWVNENEYEASFVQSDERLRVSIVKIQAETPLTPAVFADAYLSNPGQFVIGAVNGGKSNDFRTLVDAGFIRGHNDDGEFDQIQCPGLTSNQGAVMLTLDGRIIAVQLRGAGASEYGRSTPQNWVVSNEVQKGIAKLMAKVNSKDKPVSGADEDKGRPWLGFGWAPINEDYAEMSGLPKKGVIVKYVVKNSPMEQAGVKEGDLIVEVANKPLTKVGANALQSQFVKYIDPEVGKEIGLKVLRGADLVPVKVKFAKRPEPKEFRAEDIGVAVQDVTDSDYYERGLFIREGVIVNRVLPGSPAGAMSGNRTLINRDDIIIELNNNPIKTIDDFIKAVEGIRRDKAAIVLVKMSNGISTSFAALNLKGKK